MTDRNVIGCLSIINQPILKYSNEIRSAMLVLHGAAAHACCFGKGAIPFDRLQAFFEKRFA